MNKKYLVELLTNNLNLLNTDEIISKIENMKIIIENKQDNDKTLSFKQYLKQKGIPQYVIIPTLKIVLIMYLIELNKREKK